MSGLWRKSQQMAGVSPHTSNVWRKNGMGQSRSGYYGNAAQEVLSQPHGVRKYAEQVKGLAGQQLLGD